MLVITKIKLVLALSELIYKGIHQRIAIDSERYLTIYSYQKGGYSFTIYNNSDDTITFHANYNKDLDILTIVDKMWKAITKEVQ